jgi:hypothetical protein
MEAETVMNTVRSGASPSEWNVWPLRRDRALINAAKWSLLSLIGFALLVPVILATFPSDFNHAGAAQQSVATAIILLLGALAFGSLWLALESLLRAQRASEYWLVITPDLFIKAEPRRLFQIPLEDITEITLKGVTLPGDAAVQGAIGPQQFGIGQFSRITARMGTIGAMSRRSRESPSLAFRDRRNNRMVIVGTDDTFDHLAAIEHILRERVDQREEALWRASRNDQRINP